MTEARGEGGGLRGREGNLTASSASSSSCLCLLQASLSTGSSGRVERGSCIVGMVMLCSKKKKRGLLRIQGWMGFFLVLEHGAAAVKNTSS